MTAYTGGHYSLLRGPFGTYLLVHFLALLPWGREMFSREGVLPDASASPLLRLFPNLLALSDAPWVVTGLIAAGAALAVTFAIGLHDRLAAVGLWYVWACLFGRNPLISNPGLPYVGWMLLAHAFLPPAPWGSWARHRNLSDPGAGWRMPHAIHGAAWILMAVGYSYSGYTKLVSQSWLDGTAVAHVLASPLARPGLVRDVALLLPAGVLAVITWGALGIELAFAPLSLVRRLRPLLWTALLLLHLALLTLIDFVDLSLGMVMLHLFTFDPAWVRAKPAAGAEVVFYDGGCGLCHGFVRFVLSEGRDGQFGFGPLAGEAFRGAVDAEQAATLGDTIVVLTADRTLLTRSGAVLHVCSRLGGAWRVLAAMAGVVPARWLDVAYDGVARMRHHLFARPSQACPLLPPELRGRFR